MTRNALPRQIVSAALLLVPLLLVGCGTEQYPNSTFEHTSEHNRMLDSLWDTMMFWGILVFVLVEVVLVYTMWRYRRRPNAPEPKHVHGHAGLEIAWTLIPLVILVFIAVPTVRTIFFTQDSAPAGHVKIDVIGHQWWWEFRYPELGIVTANEVVIPVGKTVNFALRTADVLHSFWIPLLGGKRDLVNNRTNYLWFTPDSLAGREVFNGSCNEYCGVSHANMRFRAIALSQEEFDRWAAHQRAPAVFGGAPAPAAGSADTAGVSAQVQSATAQQRGDPTLPTPSAQAPQQQVATPAALYEFPASRLPAYAVPNTPLPAGLSFPEAVLAQGNAQRGMEVYSRSACIGCHRIAGNRMSAGILGPDLTHIGSRLTIGSGLFSNTPMNMALWIKNARRMKPMQFSSMPTLGIGETDPITKQTISRAQGGLTNEQIADIVAYLMALK